MSELNDKILYEKYRPSTFAELICENKVLILKYIEQPKTLPSFIFYSRKPGTGKTSAAKLIAKELECDILQLNASDERGIDTIRDKIKGFSQALSSKHGVKRMVFLDEADYLTSIAQASLRNIMEEMSGNCFFIFTANDISKIIEPIRSRCIQISFDVLSKFEIFKRLAYICKEENIEQFGEVDLRLLIDNYYPDMRSMISYLQNFKLTGEKHKEDEYHIFLKNIKDKNIEYIYDKVYAGQFNIMGFNKWLFKEIFDHYSEYGYEKASKIALLLADTEKSWNLGTNLSIVFLANILKIGEII